ncbi:hypothetical protein CHS0354_042834 [Potamilus streckersoni]|uniref:Geranylgeranyl transferase type-2 subunit alpha n=1 Tax=Potamilus streckersoni TaxID=2493646 RepID=A0AAE0T5F2_9BIVA|nr:hypothetical protein CHS0354_042834 [Potamilus streckersoni]
MHGRIKVKTTAEQQETKRKEREKKLKLYNAATGKIFDKRKNKEFDDDLLALTGEVLAQNSDLYTLWNIRKETFLHMKEIKTKEEMEKICNEELYFLESCLKGNPKSYGTWHHRCFVLDNMANPDWKRELQLCNIFLEYDERNFHCWDYRRLVVKRSKVPIEEELEFTTNKIHSNFSNFSSWHYRSKLLPLIYPDPTNPVGVKEEILLKEFEAVQNAFFTDPDDQSAWFYHRWLLGRGRKKMVISCLYASRPQNRVIVSTSQPVLVGSNHQMEVYLKDVSIEGSWSNVAGNGSPYSRLWISFKFCLTG